VGGPRLSYFVAPGFCFISSLAAAGIDATATRPTAAAAPVASISAVLRFGMTFNFGRATPVGSFGHGSLPVWG
jgi:hypothetical protein